MFNFIFASGLQLLLYREKQQGGGFWICTLSQGQKYHFQVDNIEQMKIEIYFQILEELLFVGVGITKHNLEKKEYSVKTVKNMVTIYHLSNGCL